MEKLMVVGHAVCGSLAYVAHDAMYPIKAPCGPNLGPSKLSEIPYREIWSGIYSLKVASSSRAYICGLVVHISSADALRWQILKGDLSEQIYYPESQIAAIAKNLSLKWLYR
jgi:hypothetical protein